MSHYFLTPEEPLVTHEFTATVFGRELTFTAAPGVFSGHRLDLGTSVLLRSVEPPTTGHVLDLGCGVGTIAVGLAVASPPAGVGPAPGGVRETHGDRPNRRTTCVPESDPL